MQYWVQEAKPVWLPEGFEVPPEMINSVQQLCQEAEIAYYQTDKDRNGFLRRREFKKAMKLLGINKYEAKHMLIFVDQERIKVVSLKNYVNAYLFIKSGGLNHINADYQGPITTGTDNRPHLTNPGFEGIPLDIFLASRRQTKDSVSSTPFQFIVQNVFQSVPRPPPVKNEITYVQTMQAANGMYLCSENGRVVANRPVASIWERFTIVVESEWTDWLLTGLRTYWNKYLTCETDNSIADNRTAIGPWEKFDGVPSPGSGKVAYKSWTGHYLTADAAGNVSFSATSIGPNEIWTCKVIH